MSLSSLTFQPLLDAVVSFFRRIPRNLQRFFERIHHALIWRLTRSANRYRYQPLGLDEFRLLSFPIDNHSSPLSFDLIHAPSNGDARYEALSYAWGDVNDLRVVRCNGKALRVTYSVFTALKAIRQLHNHPADDGTPVEEGPRLYWVDAVCIAQHDSAEKASQVPLMGVIYSKAVRVLIWLGQKAWTMPNPDESLAALSECIPNVDLEDAIESLQSNVQSLSRLDDAKMYELQHMDWQPFKQILHSPYFQRKWVVQETVLGRSALVYVGGTRIEFCRLSQLGIKLTSWGIPLFLHFDPVSHIAAFNLCMMELVRYFCNTRNPTIVDCLRATQFFQCTDPRDHVYSILALAQGARPDATSIEPNYVISTEEAYMQFTEHTLTELRDLSVLGLIQPEAPNTGNFPVLDYLKRRSTRAAKSDRMPSWVVNFSMLSGSASNPTSNYSFKTNKFAAGGPENPTPRVSRRGDGRLILKCPGAIVDTITHLAPSLIDTPTPTQVPTKLPAWAIGRKLVRASIRGILQEGAFYQHRIDLATAGAPGGLWSLPFARRLDFLNALTCERETLSDRARDRTADVDAFASFCVAIVTLLEDEEAVKVITRYNSKFSPLMSALAYTRAFGVTESGRFAALPRTTQVGDVVCVLQGGEVPYLLRPTTKGMYRFVGECYVTGIMDGEALAGEEHRLRTISIE